MSKITEPEFQVVSMMTGKYYFSGSGLECSDWIADYGLGAYQFEILPFDPAREEGDIIETY